MEAILLAFSLFQFAVFSPTPLIPGTSSVPHPAKALTSLH
jgi:hypothetical protein